MDSSNANAFKTKQLLKPYQQNSENYQIQSGLFGNVVASNISNMTISGSANAYKITDTTTVSGTVSGALIAGNILGVVKPEDDTNSTNNGYTLYDNSFVTKITDIVLDNLAIYNPIGDGTNWKSNYGLMVYGISSGANVEFDRICMSNYKDGNHVAAALIGRVGSSTAEAINLTFTNMQIADVKDHGDQEGIGRAGRTVLAYASFIYEYNYRTNTIPDNSSYGLYTFKLEDYKKGLASHTHQDGTTNTYVTLGKEIGETVQFYDDGLNDSIAAYTNDNTKNKEGLVKFSADDYKPYVYQSKQIDVNPKPGSITKGCGTYSDPYIIENTTQLYTLYQYISNHEQYHASLRNWEINQYGKDTEDPEVHEKHTLQQYKFSSVYDEKTYQTLLKNGFPSVEQLSEAYYLIKGDGNGKGKGTTIDLTGFTDFKGFGTEELPFTGVFIGEVDSSGNLAVEIKLPNQTSTASAFGFITYAKGAVVQNLKFTLPSNEEIEETTADGTKQLVEKVQMVQIAATRDKKNNYLSGGYGGAVFGCILGGDNVIANVTVSGSILAAEETSEIGGYVGRVEMGCLILRNMSSDSLKDFSIMTNEETGDTESASYNFIGGIAGAVEDGFVVADDETYENEYSGSNDLPASPLKGVVKYTTIQKAKIAVTDKDDSHQVTDYRLDTAEDLLVLSLAMNSGAMNYNARSEEVSRQAENYYAYDTTSKCRNTDYRYVGQMNTDTALAADSKQMQAYHAAVYYDNNKEMAKHADDDGEYEYSEYYYHPYIFNYFDFESYTYDSGKHDSCVLYVSNHKAQLNTIDKKSSFNYELEDGTYDLSGDGLQECFDGIGAKYHGLKTVDKPVASVVTKEQDIKVDTIPCEYDFIGNMTGDIEAPGKVKIILAITEGRTNNKSSSYAGFFNVLYAENSSDTPLQISGFTLTGSVTSTSDIVNDGDSNLAAGLAARVESPHTVSEVIVSDLAVTSDNGIAAGFVGCSHKNLTFKSCKLTSTEQKNILAKNSYAAGFVGKSDYDALTFETCEISSDDEDAAYEITSTTNVAGGFVAYGCRNVINTKNNLSQNKNQKADATPITFQNCSITCLNISTADTDKKEGAKKHLGGFVGACERKLEVNTADSAATTIQGLKIQAVKNNDNETGLGAIAGNLGNAAEIKNVTVSDAVIEYSNIVNGASSGCDAGGLIGFVNVDSADKKVNITGCTVGSLNLAESIQIGFAKATDRYAYFGGIVGFYNANTTLTLSGCKVVGVKDDYGAYTVQIQNGSYVGGLVGGGADGGAALNISDSSVSGVDMSVRRNEMSPTYNYDSVLGAAGGILGDTDSSNKTVVLDRITVSNVNITVDERKSDYAVGIVQGGVIGRVRCPVSITDVTVSGLAL
jgi:hypothetical protein